jgi:hypothetical protein
MKITNPKYPPIARAKKAVETCNDGSRAGARPYQ